MVKVRPIGVGGVDGIYNGTVMAGIRQRKRLGKSCGFGFLRFGYSPYGDSRYFQGIYQKRVTGYNHTGRIAGRKRKAYYVKMRYYRPTNPKTPFQQENRSKFAEAVSGWAALTPEEQAVYIKRGKRAGRVGRNLFISEFMKSQPD